MATSLLDPYPHWGWRRENLVSKLKLSYQVQANRKISRCVRSTQRWFMEWVFTAYLLHGSNPLCICCATQWIGTNVGGYPTSMFKSTKVTTQKIWLMQWIHRKLRHIVNWSMQQIGTNGSGTPTSMFECKKVST